MEAAAERNEMEEMDTDDVDVQPGLSQAEMESGHSELRFKCYADLFMWPSLFLRKIQAAAPERLQVFDAKLQKGIQLITDYSGLGTPEICLRFLCEAFRDLVGGSSSATATSAPLTCARAADVDMYCRRMLMAHDGPAAPACVFGQFSERCPDHLAKKTANLLETVRSSLPEKPSKEALLSAGQDFIRAGMQIMLSDLTVESCWCHKHKRACPPLPAVAAGSLSLAIAGVSCLDWSAMGNQMMWLGDTALLVECTESIDDALICELFPKYSLTSFELCPSSMGVPAKRPRKYMVLLRDDKFEWECGDPVSAFEELFHQPDDVDVDAAEFCCASKEAVDACIARFARRRGFPDKDPRGETWKLKHVMPQKLLDNIRKWEGSVRQKRDVTEGQLCTAFMNTTQKASRGSASPFCPVLITRSQIWSFKHQRYMLLQEMAEVQGFAVVTNTPFQCPFRDIILDTDAAAEDAIPDVHVRRMLGNGMSLQCVGALLAFVLCFAVESQPARKKRLTNRARIRLV
ncbi:unnamed protein product [Symbiodinium sp. CCMP2592]|nr:unnamed protein product [Symbiodinium sp. CCMP2592]